MTITEKNLLNSQETERQKMKSYWESHRDISNSSIETMMLDSNAKTLHEIERVEVLSKLPIKPKLDILELASGIGRYTTYLAKDCKSLTTIEFIEEFHNTNIKLNGGLNENIKFLCEDVLKVDNSLFIVPEMDLIFSNWLFMYFSDNEIVDFANKICKWMKPNAYLFFRESCWHQSGDVKRTSGNPTHYRTPSQYVSIFNATNQLELISSSNIDVYRKIKNNHGQVYFLWRKKAQIQKLNISLKDISFQQFLDHEQYSKNSILRYELIFGKGYISTGGQETTTEFVNMLNLKKYDKVLDVGCGIGGGDFYMAKKYNVNVTGIDLSSNMIYFAIERSMSDDKSINDLLNFEICDATTKYYPENTFDVIYSRDTILHIKDKLSLFKNFYKWLKPGGQLLISDYCCSDNVENSKQRFKDYVKSRGYYLLSPKQYGQVIEDSGFSNIQVYDKTEQFIQILKKELQSAKDNKENFIRLTTEKDFNEIVNGWETKLIRCADGDQKWGLFYAKKI